MPSFIMGSMDEIAASVEEERKEKEEQPNPEEEDFDFNLEDTILAAASAQGIDIPDKTEEEEALPCEEESSVEEKSETEEALELEEEPMTEEDLQRAEEEFLNGGSAERKEEFDSSFLRRPFRRKVRKSLHWKSFISQRKKSWSSLLIP